LEAIQEVLKIERKPLPHREIYKKIVQNNFYSFKAKDPSNVVQQQLRRHCIGLDFPSSKKNKYFKIVDSNKSLTTYYLLEKNEKNQTTNVKLSNQEKLPEETISEHIQQHKRDIEQELLETILNSKPSFFEELVVKLLLKMGYGWDKSKSGFVNGKSGDGGIDGIIFEDKLGLGKIYIQAKRYSDKSIGRPELQQFVGAMEHNHKGVYISTSTFTKQAREYIEKQSKNIVLIDGQKLVSLLVENRIGIEIIETLHIYKVDDEFFKENN
jgi:restriction system protein